MSYRGEENMMLSDAMEDEDKWLAEGVAGIQHNAYYMHRALVIYMINFNFLYFLFDLILDFDSNQFGSCDFSLICVVS